MPDYIPSGDAEFNTWLSTFISALNTRGPALGVTPAEIAAIQGAQETWNVAFAEHNEAQAAASSATQTKKQARQNLENVTRATIKRLQTHPNIQDADRTALGITIPETGRAPAPPPTTRPVAVVDTSQRLRHTISFSDETTPTRRAKPDGVRGCEIWVKIGEPPAGPSDAAFLALDTASPYLAEYPDADAGKIAHYMLRWVNSREERGPWSQTVSATITA